MAETLPFLLNAVASALCLAVYLRRASMETIFSPLFWYLMFHGFVFLIRPAVGLFFPLKGVFDYMRFTPNSADLGITHFIVALALVAFTAGYEYAVSRSIQAVSPQSTKEFSWRAIGICWCLLGPFAIYSCFVTGSSMSTGGLEMDRVNGVAITAGTSGYLTDAQYMLVGLCVLLAWRARFSLWAMLPTVVFLTFRASIGSGRWSIILTALALLFAYTLQNKNRWPPRRMWLGIAPLGLLFFMLGQDRNLIGALLRGETRESTYFDHEKSWLDIFDGLDFANFDFLAYIINAVPDLSHTFTFGVQYLQIFTEPIPRGIWTGKPAGAPIQFFNLSDFGNFNALTPSIVGDAWISGGYIGVIIILFAYGSFLGRLYRRFISQQMKLTSQIAYVCFAALFVQIFRDGGIISLVKFPALTLCPFLVAEIADRNLQKKSLP